MQTINQELINEFLNKRNVFAVVGVSKESEKYGTGHIEGIVDAGTANNAGLGGAWVPALVFGIIPTKVPMSPARPTFSLYFFTVLNTPVNIFFVCTAAAE